MAEPSRRRWSVEQYFAAIGQEIGLSRWIEVSQARIDAFAEVTEDRQFIHLDPEAAAQTPFGGTVAHGFLTLSLLSAMSYDALPELDGAQMSVNYGFDRVRFVSPVRAGSRLRARFTLEAADILPAAVLALRLGVIVEIEGEERPALAATWITRRTLGEP